MGDYLYPRIRGFPLAIGPSQGLSDSGFGFHAVEGLRDRERALCGGHKDQPGAAPHILIAVADFLRIVVQIGGGLIRSRCRY